MKQIKDNVKVFIEIKPLDPEKKMKCNHPLIPRRDICMKTSIIRGRRIRD